jgi:hypothetical protein
MKAQIDHHDFGLTHSAAGQAFLTAVALIVLATIVVWFLASSPASGLF